MTKTSGKIEDQNIVALFLDYVHKVHPDIIKQTQMDNNYLFLIINFSMLCEYNSFLSQRLLSQPDKTLTLFNRCLLNVFDPDKRPARCIVRVSSLPLIPEVFSSRIPRSDQIGHFFALQCTVTRVGAIQVVQLERSYACLKCGHTINTRAVFNQYYALQPPKRCPTEDCNSTNFKPLKQTEKQMQSCQEIRVNEQLSCLSVGKMPRSIFACLDNDLVDVVRPGDDIILNGVLTHRWKALRPGAPCEIEVVIAANYIENLSEMKFRGVFRGSLSREVRKRFQEYWVASPDLGYGNSLQLRDEIVRNICPEVYGLYYVKLSLALLLVGAPPCHGEAEPVNTQNPIINRNSKASDDFRVRGSLHLLLVGEPSTAKSALLRASCRLAVGRAVFTSATGTTAAGLTAAAVRDSSGWALESGALVLADGGVCAIDEFSCLRGADQAAVHEAMEQQTVSIAKAGLVARLNCRCSVVAASTLPQGEVGAEGLGLPTPLLSRFDVVWRLVDPIKSDSWDSTVADFVLGIKDVEHQSFSHNGRIRWTTEDIRHYFSWTKSEFQPHLSPGPAVLLQHYYELRRRVLQTIYGSENDQALAGRTTLRLLESLVRLTQAHARLMARHNTCVEDAIVAIWLMDSSLQSTFGSKASTIDIEGHSLSPEETVTCHNINYDFDQIQSIVLAKLKLTAEDIDCDWFYQCHRKVKSDAFLPSTIATPLAASTQFSTKLNTNIDENDSSDQEQGVSPFHLKDFTLPDINAEPCASTHIMSEGDINSMDVLPRIEDKIENPSVKLVNKTGQEVDSDFSLRLTPINTHLALHDFDSKNRSTTVEFDLKKCIWQSNISLSNYISSSTTNEIKQPLPSSLIIKTSQKETKRKISERINAFEFDIDRYLPSELIGAEQIEKKNHLNESMISTAYSDAKQVLPNSTIKTYQKNTNDIQINLARSPLQINQQEADNDATMKSIPTRQYCSPIQGALHDEPIDDELVVETNAGDHSLLNLFSRSRSKLAKFCFIEAENRVNQPVSEIVSCQLTNPVCPLLHATDKFIPPATKRSLGRGFLDFGKLSADDWSLANIDIDFDL